MSDSGEEDTSFLQEALKRKREKLGFTRLGDEPDPQGLLEGEKPKEK